MNKPSYEQNLTNEELEILQVFAAVIPSLPKLEKARLLGMGQGIAFKVTRTDYPDRKTG